MPLGQEKEKTPLPPFIRLMLILHHKNPKNKRLYEVFSMYLTLSSPSSPRRRPMMENIEG
jgi:hypothetical protein